MKQDEDTDRGMRETVASRIFSRLSFARSSFPRICFPRRGFPKIFVSLTIRSQPHRAILDSAYSLDIDEDATLFVQRNVLLRCIRWILLKYAGQRLPRRVSQADERMPGDCRLGVSSEVQWKPSTNS